MNEFEPRSLVALRPADRHPQLAADAELEDERRGHDADDVRAPPSIGIGLPTMRRIGAVAARPQPVAQDDDAIAARVLFVRQERAAEHRPDAEHLEEARGDAQARRPARLRRAGEVVAACRPSRTARGCRTTAALEPVAVVRHRDDVDVAPGSVRGPSTSSPAAPASGNGSRLQQRRVDDAEHRRVGADAEGQREDGDEREAGRRRSVRIAYRTFCRSSSSQRIDRASRCDSLACSTPPKARRAARRASSGGSPLPMNSSSSCRRWAVISRVSSRSARPGRRNDSRRRTNRRGSDMAVTSGWADDQLVHEPRELAPALDLLVERAQAGPGDGVVLRLAVALGPLPRALDPPFCSSRVSAAYSVPWFSGNGSSATCSRRAASP